MIQNQVGMFTELVNNMSFKDLNTRDHYLDMAIILDYYNKSEYKHESLVWNHYEAATKSAQYANLQNKSKFNKSVDTWRTFLNDSIIQGARNKEFHLITKQSNDKRILDISLGKAAISKEDAQVFRNLDTTLSKKVAQESFVVPLLISVRDAHIDKGSLESNKQIVGEEEIVSSKSEMKNVIKAKNIEESDVNLDDLFE